MDPSTLNSSTRLYETDSSLPHSSPSSTGRYVLCLDLFLSSFGEFLSPMGRMSFPSPTESYRPTTDLSPPRVYGIAEVWESVTDGHSPKHPTSRNLPTFCLLRCSVVPPVSSLSLFGHKRRTLNVSPLTRKFSPLHLFVFVNLLTVSYKKFFNLC